MRRCWTVAVVVSALAAVVACGSEEQSVGPPPPSTPVTTAFTGSADFSGMVDGVGLSLDVVEHEAFVEVDEQGTRAAAATGGAMVASHGPSVFVDRPFLYFIRDRGAGTILFVGPVTDPSITP